jgi:thiol:disulfide interchange protein DsbC
VQDHYVIGRDVGLNGTPAIVLDDGTLISGYLPPDQLAARLEQNAVQQ